MSSKQMIINTVEGQECRIAILKDGRLEELYTERVSSASSVGSIYKGRVTNIEPSIQAAFVDFGGPKNGFLHISDLHPQYFPKGRRGAEQVGRRTAHRTRPPIQECLHRGQEIVVQMTKQGIGTKGPTLTTYLSIPGRLIVMMPGMTHVGISRKIEDEEARSKLRDILQQLEVPKDLGIIVRTAGVDRSKRDLQRDLAYLSRLWKAVQQRIDTSRAPAEIYQESDLVVRTIRDVLDAEVERIVCDNQAVAVKVMDFLDVAVPRSRIRIDLYRGGRGLFEEFGVEEEIRKAHARVVELEKGGSLVIDQTEALVAIDVNSGSFRAHTHAETNALNLNLAAAEEIGRQLRLRDMGGVIIIDFVDMREEKNRRQLERRMRDVLKNDRAKNKALRISNFGILEMTRQRLRPSLKQSLFDRCRHCDGTGLVMSRESAALEVMRILQLACANNDVARVEVAVAPSVAHHLSNVQRQAIADLENRSGKKLIVCANPDLGENDIHTTCTNSRGAPVAWESVVSGAKHNAAEFVDAREFLSRREPDAESDADESFEEQEPPPAGQEGQPQEGPPQEPSAPPQPQGERKKRRRGRRGGRHRRKTPNGNEPFHGAPPPQDHHDEQAETYETPEPFEPTVREEPPTNISPGGAPQTSLFPEGSIPAQPPPKKKRRHRGGRRHKKRRAPVDAPAAETPPPAAG